MFKVIDKIKVNYKQYGKGKDLVLLHGWGQNIAMMEPIGDYLKDYCRVTIVDLPGFGLSNEPTFPYSPYDYVEFLKKLFEEIKVDNPTLIGHSFGGRLSIIYASKYPTKKVILFGSPCVRHEYKSRKQDLLKKLKKVKLLNPLVKYLKNHTGSVDYRNASPLMKDILVKTVNEDLSDCAKKINCPCLLVWGENDTAVPIEQAKELDSLLKNSSLIILPGTHYAYLENIERVNNIIMEFIKEDL